MEILQSLGINNSFYIQLINFLILVVILYFLLYKPLFKTIAERSDKIAKGLELTAKLESELELLEKKRLEIISQAQLKGDEIIDGAKKAATVEVEKIIESANQKSESMLKQFEKKLASDQERLEAEMETKVYESVKLVMKKLLKSDSDLDKKYISNVLKSDE